MEFLPTHIMEIRPDRKLNVYVIDEAGAKKGTIFMIHGAGGRALQWREQIEFFKKDYCLVIPDLLGQGSSEKPKPNANDSIYSFSEDLNDLKFLFERFAGTKNYMIGHSRGGALAVQLALNYQTRVEKLILIAPIACKSYENLPPSWDLSLNELEKMRSELEKSFVEFSFDHQTDKKLIEIEIAAGKNNPMYVLKPIFLDMKNIPEIDLHKLEIPTLILMGESDQIVPPQKTQAFYKALPHHQFITIEHAAHMLMLEQNKIVNDDILKFLQS